MGIWSRLYDVFVYSFQFHHIGRVGKMDTFCSTAWSVRSSSSSASSLNLIYNVNFIWYVHNDDMTGGQDKVDDYEKMNRWKKCVCFSSSNTNSFRKCRYCLWRSENQALMMMAVVNVKSIKSLHGIILMIIIIWCWTKK